MAIVWWLTSARAPEPPAPGAGTRLTTPPPSPAHSTASPLAVQDGATRSDGVVRGSWGGGSNQFGRRREPESNPEAPMAVCADRAGNVLVLDQVNRRVLRYRDSVRIGSFPIGSDAAQDIAFARGEHTLVLDRLADRSVLVYDRSGTLQNELPLIGKGIPEGGSVTGLLADEEGIYLEREHGQVVRIADPMGHADTERPEFPGRPSRDGRFWLSANIVDRTQGRLEIHATARSGGSSWAQPIALGHTVLRIVLLESDRHGRIYVAGETGEESTNPPYAIEDERLVVVRLSSSGAHSGTLELPPVRGPYEIMRPVTVNEEGAIYEMVATDSGLTITRYEFP